MISRKHKAIFIHIEKTAGTSIEKKLGLFNELKRGVQDHNKIRYYERMANSAYKLRSLSYALYCLKRGKNKKSVRYFKNLIVPELTKYEYKSFYKFSFVRSSWSRMHSYYVNVMKDNVLRDYMNIGHECSFKEFIGKIVDPKHFNQLDYLRETDGSIPLDFIGRFENLDEDFNQVCKKLGLEDSNLPKLLITKDKEHYTNFYDEETKDLVFNLYREEIDYFKFEYGN